MRHKLYQVEKNGNAMSVKYIMEMQSSEKPQSLDYLHVYYQWKAEKNGYLVWLDAEGKRRFNDPRYPKFEVHYPQSNAAAHIVPDKSVLFTQGSYISTPQAANKKIIFHAAEERYIPLLSTFAFLVRQREQLVFLAIDTDSDTLVVVKMKSPLHPQYKRFVRSSALLQPLRSSYLPQLKPIKGDSKSGTVLFYGKPYHVQIFEYVCGQSLDKRLSAITAGEKAVIQLVPIFYEISKAIYDLHQCDIVYRNLASEHVLIEESDMHGEARSLRVKLAGLSLLARKTDDKQMVDSEDLGMTFCSASASQLLPVQEEETELTMAGEFVGSCFFPAFGIDNKSRDACSILFFFLHAILPDASQQQELLQLLQSPKSQGLADNLAQFMPEKKLPLKVRASIQQTVDKLCANQCVAVAEVCEIFADALGQTFSQISRFDQYPMPQTGSIRINGAEADVWYEPLDELGGDFYDVVPLANDQYGILIGDIMGHGLRAAFYTQLIYPVARLFADLMSISLVTPQKVLEKMHQLLRDVNTCDRDKKPNTPYATASYGILTVAERIAFRYANAGHHVPILLRRGVATYTESAGNGFALCFIPSRFAASETTIELQHGDLLLLYTDGILETKNRCGQEFGEVLLDTIQAAASDTDDVHLIVQRVRQAFDDFCAKKYDDDITLIAIKIL